MKPINSSNFSSFITRMTKHDAIEPIIALEACVVAGRTLQAYKRGGADEARERVIEESSGSVVWLFGVKLLNKLQDVILGKILKKPGVKFDVGKDKLRTPFANFMQNANKSKYSETAVAMMKASKVLISIIIANSIMGFLIPKFNHALTNKLIKDRTHDKKDATVNSTDNFVKENSTQVSSLSFKGGAMGAINTFTNVIENTNTGQLLSTDFGVAGGRMYNARTNEERREVAIRDLGSIYFYMWAQGHLCNLLNLIETGHANRLNPTTAGILNEHLIEFIKSNNGKMNVQDFRKATLGLSDSEIKIPDGINFEKDELSWFGKLTNQKPLEVAKLSEVEALIEDSAIKERLRQMSQLQPNRVDGAVITKQQIIDAYNKAEINNPELLSNVFNEFTGGTKADGSKIRYVGGASSDPYSYVSNKSLYSLKNDMKNYIDGICKAAKDGNVDEKLLNKVKNKNITYSGANFLAGFVFAAVFLSTLIPKFQYYITKKTTGVDAFPGLYDYEHNKKID